MAKSLCWNVRIERQCQHNFHNIIHPIFNFHLLHVSAHFGNRQVDFYNNVRGKEYRSGSLLLRVNVLKYTNFKLLFPIRE